MKRFIIRECARDLSWLLGPVSTMDMYESNTHSFVVKVWVEEILEEAEKVVWRGKITHVPSGSSTYVADLGDISDFIARYLEEMGVKLMPGEQGRQASQP